MNKHVTEIVAAWIVAVVLIGALALQLWPRPPAHVVGLAVPASRAPALRETPALPDTDLPLYEYGDETLPVPTPQTATPAGRANERGSSLQAQAGKSGA